MLDQILWTLTRAGFSNRCRSDSVLLETRGASMSAVALRKDHDAASLRSLAKASKSPGGTRRLLALAAIYDGGSRTDAARIGAVGLQTVRDWVLRFNARGPEGLVDGKAPGPKSKLDDEHRRALVAKIEAGPIPAVDGVVCWRLIDLAQWVFDLRGLRHLRHQTDPQPRATRHGISQALGASPSSRERRGGCGPF